MEENRPLRIKALACEVLAREVYLAAARSPHAIDVELLEKGLHDDANVLRAELQRRLNALPEGKYDGVALVYGLCNRATEGLVAPGTPMALVRSHDCITLFLGSRERYLSEFEAHPGTYYYSAEWLERGAAGSVEAAGAPQSDEGMAYGSRLPAEYEELVRKYGEENAKYLREVYGSWRQHYTRTAYIGLPCGRCEVAGCGHDAPYRARARATAERNGWEYVELEGQPDLVNRLLEGEWWAAYAAGTPEANEDILVVPPGQTIVATFDERVIAAGAVG